MGGVTGGAWGARLDAPAGAHNGAGSAAADEQYRVLARRIETLLGAGRRRVGVTSSVAGEGRSSTAVNLSLALALAGRHRVVLVDAHLRSPALERLLGLSPAPGLADAVAGRVEALSALRRLPGDELCVLSAGQVDAPHALLAAPRLAAVLDELAGQFDAVIVDAPPILPAADLLSIAPALDLLLLVVQAGRTPRELVGRAVAALGDAQPKIAGVVLHRVEAGVGAPWRLFARHDREERERARAVAAAALPLLAAAGVHEG